jgi:hypothetical protein
LQRLPSLKLQEPSALFSSISRTYWPFGTKTATLQFTPVKIESTIYSGVKLPSQKYSGSQISPVESPTIIDAHDLPIVAEGNMKQYFIQRHSSVEFGCTRMLHENWRTLGDLVAYSP